MPDGSWPSPVGVGGGTTPAFGHPSLKEGNVRGSLASAGRRCILLRQPSPARRPSPPRPQAAPTRGPNHHVLSESNAPSLPQTVSTQGPEHHGEPERNTPIPPADSIGPATFPSIPLLWRGARRAGWSGGVAEGRGGRPATAVRPLPTPPAPPPPFCPKGLSLTRRVDGVRVDDGADCFLRKSLPKINNLPLNSKQGFGSAWLSVINRDADFLAFRIICCIFAGTKTELYSITYDDERATRQSPPH